MKSKLTIRRAVFIPFIVTILLAILTFVFSWRLDYNQLSGEQSSKILRITNENIKEKLENFLGEPKNLALVFHENIKFLKLYDSLNYQALESYMLRFMESFHQDLPQISVLFYGDEHKHFIGYRANSLDDDYSLMLQDERTNESLVIYNTEHITMDIAASYSQEDYDPTTRPWYKPVKENPITQWSEVYVNYDEINDATISIMNPLVDENGLFVGVSGLDVKLNGIHDFLKSEAEKSEGVIYIIDSTYNLVATSGDEGIIEIDLNNQEPTGNPLQATESQNEIISASALLYKQGMGAEVESFEYNNERYYALKETLTTPEGLNWSVVSVLTEDVLMGGIKDRQNLTLLIVLFVIILGSAIALAILSKMVKPIREGTALAVEIAEGNWDANLSGNFVKLKETDALLKSLDTMTSNLKSSFEVLTVNEAKYRELVESLEEMVYTISAKDRFTSVNKPFENYFEMDRAALVGVEAKPFFKGHLFKDDWYDAYLKLLETGQAQKFQVRLERHGKEQVLNFTLVPVINEQDEISMILGSISDVTELLSTMEKLNEMTTKENERLEELVEKRTRELEQTMKELANSEKLASLGALVSGVAHEINTPLGVAVTTASYIEKINRENLALLEANKITKSGFMNFIDHINESIGILNTNLNRASELIKSFKMISVNQSQGSVERFNLYKYLEATVVSLKHELKHGQHTVNILVDKELFIRSYPGAYSQILTNLIMNSILHGFGDRMHGQINLHANLDGSHLVMTYHDDGKGIEQEALGKIFDPFYTSNRGKGGSGLGLNVVYNLVTGQLGGTIICESEISKGTTFTLNIPLEKE